MTLHAVTCTESSYLHARVHQERTKTSASRPRDIRNFWAELPITHAAKALGMKAVLRVSNQGRSSIKRHPLEGYGFGIPMRSRFASGSRISISNPQGASSTSTRNSFAIG